MAINSTSALYNANDPYEILISQMIAIERQPQDTLKAEKKNQERMKLVMSDVDSKISALHTLIKEFRDGFSSPFRGRAANVPQNSAFAVSASDSAAFGSHTLNVERLAAADTRISKQYTAAAGDLRSFFDTNGAQTFTIRIAKPTDTDPANVEDVSVTVDPTGTTNSDILKEIRAAINTAMDDAVTAGTISNADKAAASVVNETSGTARLSLRSGKTGYDNRLQFTDSANGLLSLLEMTAETQATGTGGGAVVAVGTSETDSALNSKFTLDGLTLYRSTNTVTDALDGITLTLKKAGEGPVEFDVATNADGIKNKVNDFIKKYNDLLVYLQNKSTVDTTAGTRGDFAGDTTFTGLRFGLRDDAARRVTGLAAGAPAGLSELGIKMEKDGTLVLGDAEKLIAAVEKDASAVESLFAADGATSDADGIATRLLNRLDAFIGSKGIVNGRKKGIDDRLSRLDTRIKGWDATLAQREEQLRLQFARMQETIAVLQGQSQYFSSFFGMGF